MKKKMIKLNRVCTTLCTSVLCIYKLIHKGKQAKGTTMAFVCIFVIIVRVIACELNRIIQDDPIKLDYYTIDTKHDQRLY